MIKGTTFAQAMRAMKVRGVDWPISRAMAIREHGIPKPVLEEMERRGLVRPGKVPVEHLPPPTNDARLDSFIRDATELGVRWPATRASVWGYVGVSTGVIRALLRHGLIRGPELHDGSLTPSQVSVLEHLGIASKEEFRVRMAAGKLPDLRRLRNMGRQSVEKLMSWAFGNEMPPVKVGLTLRVARETKEALEVLREQRGLASRDETVEQLVAEAVGDTGRKRWGL
ncbi:MAG: hypothetical protein HY301_21540 [Verrucomicrobia bacterium]|nr:hypothetical protein [Verrucomicrobiota bacterium]